MLLEHTHVDEGSYMRWELEPEEGGCLLRLSHFVPDVPGSDRPLLRWSASIPRSTGSNRVSPVVPSRGTGTGSWRHRRTTPVLGSLRRSTHHAPVVAGAVLQRFARRVRHRGGAEPGTALRPRRPHPAVLLACRHRQLTVYRTEPGGTRGLDDYLTRDAECNIGAEIMGRNKFGPAAWPLGEPRVAGLVGRQPPFHTPVFVLTHHVRPSSPCPTPRSTSSTPRPAEALARPAGGGRSGRTARRWSGHHPRIP